MILQASSATPLAVLFPPSPEQEAEIARLLELIEANHRFLVVSHTSPDGDAVGATLAMGLLLERMGKEVVFYNQDPIPFNLQFLPAADRWVNALPAGAPPLDVTVVLDCAEPGRVGASFPAQGWGAQVAVVDHHKTWDPHFAQVYVRDVEAAATGEVIYRVLVASGVPLDLEIARCLYCCLFTDTGSFRYSSTSRITFQIAGELLAAGVDPWEMTSHIYESQPVERLQLLSRALSTLSLSSCGRLATMRLEQQMFRDVLGEGYEEIDHGGFVDGFINHARAVRGVEVATQLYEVEPNVWRISFRSRGKVDVSQLAERFGGGGHHNAAGCMISGDAARIEAELAQELGALLDA